MINPARTALFRRLPTTPLRANRKRGRPEMAPAIATCFGRSRSRLANGRSRKEESSVRPVLHLETGHLPKVPNIPGNQRCVVRQGDAGDQQVCPADLLELLVLPKPVELVRSRVIKWHCPVFRQLFSAEVSRSWARSSWSRLAAFRRKSNRPCSNSMRDTTDVAGISAAIRSRSTTRGCPAMRCERMSVSRRIIPDPQSSVYRVACRFPSIPLQGKDHPSMHRWLTIRPLGFLASAALAANR